MLAGRELILAVTGSIAAYKAAYLLRELRRAEAGVTGWRTTMGSGRPFSSRDRIDARSKRKPSTCIWVTQ